MNMYIRRFITYIMHLSFSLPVRYNKVAFMIYTVCMLLTSLIPMKSSRSASPFWTKIDPSLQNLLHIPMFIVFVFICSQTCKDVSWCKGRMPLVILGAAIFFSVAMEGLQIAVPGRYPSSADIFLNILGSAIGYLFLSIIKNKLKSGKKLNRKDTFNE